MIAVNTVTYPAPAGYMTPRAIASISDLIVHHTAGAVTQTPLEIDAEHRAIGDAMIAYNYVITPDGKVYTGRPIDVVPAAAYGRNAQSINVVLVGNFEAGDAGYTGPPTKEQTASLEALAIQLHRQYPTIERTYGHRDVATLFYANDTAPYATACPGSVLYAELASIKRAIGTAINVH